jgi:hypothetical protein
LPEALPHWVSKNALAAMGNRSVGQTLRMNDVKGREEGAFYQKSARR